MTASPSYLAAEPWLAQIRKAIREARAWVREEERRRNLEHQPPEIRLRVIAALVVAESTGDELATNPEGHYRYLWDVAGNRPFREITEAERRSETPPEDFSAPTGVPLDAEWWFQQIGLGLMQVQGAVARERGYRGRWLSGLYRGPVSLRYGVRHFAWYSRDRSEDAAIASYNGGPQRGPDFRNPGYLEDVRAIEQELPMGIDR